MALLKEILFQEAINICHATKLENLDNNRFFEKAKENLKSYNKECCPVCWIRDLNKSPLIIKKNIFDSTEGSCDSCRCEHCGFVKEFFL